MHRRPWLWAWRDPRSPARDTAALGGGATAMDSGYGGAGDDPFMLELAALRALTRITAGPGPRPPRSAQPRTHCVDSPATHPSQTVC